MTKPVFDIARNTCRSLVVLATTAALASFGSGCASSDEVVPGDNAEDKSDALSPADAIARAEEWVDAELRYCNGVAGGHDYEDKCWPLEGGTQRCNRERNPDWDAYRSDCSGLVSWAWGLPAPGPSTQGFAPYDKSVTDQISAADLVPGDALNLRQNGHNHIMLFKQWEDPGKVATLIEEPGCGSIPHAREFTRSVAITSDGDLRIGDYAYHAIRYRNFTSGGTTPTKTVAASTPSGDVFGVKMNGTPGTTEVHIVSRNSDWQTFSNETTTPLEQTKPDQYAFAVGDYDGDGSRDLFALKMNGTATNSLEVHVLSAASNFQAYPLETGTPLGQVGPGQWTFATGDADGDGRADLYAIAMNGTGTSTTEVHILTAESGYQKWLYETPTVLEMRDPANTAFLVGDYNGDGTPDLWAIKTNASGTPSTEIHVLDGATYFQSYLLQTGTALAPTDTSTWRYALADANDDGVLDLMAIATYVGTGSQKTEVHVLSGASAFQEFNAHSATVLDPTDHGQWWLGAN